MVEDLIKDANKIPEDDFEDEDYDSMIKSNRMFTIIILLYMSWFDPNKILKKYFTKQIDKVKDIISNKRQLIKKLKVLSDQTTTTFQVPDAMAVHEVKFIMTLFISIDEKALNPVQRLLYDWC